MTENLPLLPAPEETAAQQATLVRQRWIIAGVIAGVVILVALLVWAVVALSSNPAAAANVRDIFIIFMALESLLVGAALVVLIIQLASLINLLQNEVRPILKSTNETVNTLRGTSEFLSENLVEPVIKLNSYMAGLKKLFDLFGVKIK
jgi:heme/copper-type cytochrome/quinol oxidase subunit 2